MIGAGDGVEELGGDALAGWDAAAVDAPGGHVYQSRAWAEHRAATGWTPRFLAVGQVRALVLVRPWPGLPGGSAYIPRGPVGSAIPWSFDGAPADAAAGRAIGDGLAAIEAALTADGVDPLAADPEVADNDAAYLHAIGLAGFHQIPEIQPSRHRMALRLAGADEAAVFDGVARATRQRIHGAERGGIVVIRHDADPRDWDGFVRPSEGPGMALERFHELMVGTGIRRGFAFPGPGDYLGWWRRGIAAGHIIHLEARAGGADGPVLGGLMLYRHGSRLTTRHAADLASGRRDQPGTMHLLRWRAIQLAIAEGRAEMDLGGVDVPGVRRAPERGEPTYGLYAHKRSFGAEWTALAGAHEHVEHHLRSTARRAAAGAARVLDRNRRRAG